MPAATSAQSKTPPDNYPQGAMGGPSPPAPGPSPTGHGPNDEGPPENDEMSSEITKPGGVNNPQVTAPKRER